MGEIEQIADAVLYEGYVLWPYRRSTMKNRQRWTFGGVYPPAFSRAQGGHDPFFMQTDVLVGGLSPDVTIQVRFLQVVDRQIFRRVSTGIDVPVDELAVGEERFLTWEEATEHAFATEPLRLLDLDMPHQLDIEIPEGSEDELIRTPNGSVAGKITRSWTPIEATVEVVTEPVNEELHQVTVIIANQSSWSGDSRSEAIRRSPVSTHTILTVEYGEFYSMTDPPDHIRDAAAECYNLHTWPVLVGENGANDAMLSSPIILYDYPQVAPESKGDLFDSTEIDQLLLLSILSLSDEEKAELKASDQRAREILDRAESLSVDDFMSLHGATREFQVRTLGGAGASPVPAGGEAPVSFGDLELHPPEVLVINNVPIERGSRVVLRPQPGGDVFDVALDGKFATVESIEQDYDVRVFVTVTIDDDPGRDLGREKMIGHRFYFSPEEVEPVVDDDSGGAE